MSASSGLLDNGQNEAGGRPTGGSIGRALAIRPGVLNDDLRAAVAAIDRVHGVTDLPRVPMEFRIGMRSRGRILYESATGSPSRILVRADTDHRMLSAIHEIGHFLDLTALAQDRTFGSAANPAMREWFQAVIASKSYRDLIRFQTTEVEDQVVPLLLPEELWARCYAQYVATRSSRVDLVESVDALRASRKEGLHIPVHWNDNDFIGIATAIDRLFKILGWRQ